MVEKKSCRARLKDKRRCIDTHHPRLSIARQCQLLGLPRSTRYYAPAGETAENLALMRRIDEQYLRDALLRQPQDGVRAGRQSQTRAAADAGDGLGGDLSEAADDAAGRRTQDLPVFTAECGDHAARPGVVQRHHVRAAAARLFVPGGGDGLVQPLRAGVAVVEHAGRKFLRGGSRRGADHEAARRFSTAIKDRNSRRRPSRADWRSAAWRSAWMAAAERSTTCSSSGCGGA